MARDFRPKSARGGEMEKIKVKTRKDKEIRKKAKEMSIDGSSEDNDDELKLEDIRAMGGDASDIKLLRKQKGKSKADMDDDVEDPGLSNEVLKFMQVLDFKSAGVTVPTITLKERLTHKKESEDLKTDAEDNRNKKKPSRKAETNSSKIIQKSKDKAKEDRKKNAKDSIERPETDASTSALETGNGDIKIEGGFLVEPTARWSNVQLPPLQCPAASAPSASEIASLQERGGILLKQERNLYAENNRRGKRLGPAMLSSSDAKFIAELLAPGAKGGTLSDRVAALTMLAQSSPMHNLDAMDSLLQMSGKKGREESGRATRGLADWLASDGGLSQKKLRYMRDHPSTNQLVQLLLRTKEIDSNTRALADAHLLVVAFEDRLKKLYFSFIQILETQSHDSLPFVRKQAVTQIYLLLKEKSEQEQNLLRLLVNKLGDTDRAVASKASSSLLNILTIHPNMKEVISKEISSIIMKSTGGSSGSSQKANLNSHARYYGMLTLNQIMLTGRDVHIANELVNLYFELFESILGELNIINGGKGEGREIDGAKEEHEADKIVKQRWRGGRKGKFKKGILDQSKVIKDADAKIMAAVLTGVRRALPFSKIDATILERHMSTLFRITHSSTFNISIQALQLIFQVTLTDLSTPSSDSNQAVSILHVEDRFYRALYASMMDPRLATTSKQAMYLNLLFKAIKSDGDSRRVKAFIKRFVQTFDHAEPPWICGGLYLLGELMIAMPGLKTLIKEPEDEGDEHFVDAVEFSDEDGSRDILKEQTSSVSQSKEHVRYDALKREPQYSKAENSCLWEVIPLLSHFHPSVSLHARQLLLGERVTTTADLTLNTLSHFLDRFVYRNPKKSIVTSKGVSIMQPAVNNNNDGKIGVESGVVQLKGVGIRKDEYVNDEDFWKKKVQDVPVDQLFFHKYFAEKIKRSGVEDIDDEERGDFSDEDQEGEGSRDDSEDEKEIWKAMKKTMPRMDGDDEMLKDDSDVDEDDEDMMRLMAEDDDSQEEEEEDLADDSDEIPFDEDEDDLISIDFQEEDNDEEEEEGEGTKTEVRGKKRILEEEEEEEVKKKSKSKLRREEKKRRKALPTFASAEDYAHLLGKSDDEEEEGKPGEDDDGEKSQ